MTISRAILVILLLSVPCALIGCGAGSNPVQANGSITSAPVQFRSLVSTLSSNTRSFAIGQVYTATLQVKNVGTMPVSVELSPEGPKFNAVVQQNAIEIWRRSRHIGGSVAGVFLPGPTIIVPNETQTYSFTWDGSNDQNQLEPAGHYTIKAWLNASSIDGVSLLPTDKETNLAPSIDIDLVAK